MGQSTDGQLAYGFIFEDGYEFPWDTEPFDGDEKEWWRTVQGFDAAKGYPAEGWLDYQKEFDAAHPCPVKVVNYCSGEYPMYMLAIPSSVRSARRGYPERIESLPDISEAEQDAFEAFISKYNLKPEGESGWFLSSYWG